MRRRSSLLIWVGFLVVVASAVSYFVVFYRFPATRDLPWANLVLFLLGAWLLVVGVKRALTQPERYRGKAAGVILGVLGGVVIACFVVVFVFHLPRTLPASAGAPRVGQKAPDFTLLDKDGNSVTLSHLLAPPGGSEAERDPNPKAVLLIFYRGYW